MSLMAAATVTVSKENIVEVIGSEKFDRLIQSPVDIDIAKKEFGCVKDQSNLVELDELLSMLVELYDAGLALVESITIPVRYLKYLRSF